MFIALFRPPSPRLRRGDRRQVRIHASAVPGFCPRSRRSYPSGERTPLVNRNSMPRATTALYYTFDGVFPAPRKGRIAIAVAALTAFMRPLSAPASRNDQLPSGNCCSTSHLSAA